MNTFEIDVLKHVVKDKYHGKWMPQEEKSDGRLMEREAPQHFFIEMCIYRAVRGDERGRKKQQYKTWSDEWISPPKEEKIVCVLSAKWNQIRKIIRHG